MSPEYIQSIEEVDRAIGALIGRLKAAKLYEDTYFLLITDHGGKGKSHGGMSPVEMEVPWAITGPGIQSGNSFSAPNNNTNTAVVLAQLLGCRKLPAAWTGQIPGSIFSTNTSK
jgi:arylsulfatase A-like enzyme